MSILNCACYFILAGYSFKYHKCIKLKYFILFIDAETDAQQVEYTAINALESNMYTTAV